MANILYIVNPAAYGGKASKFWKRIKSSLDIDSDDIKFTTKPGDATTIASFNVGYDIIVAVGGDGTVSEVVTGIMSQSEPRPKLAVIPVGTGNDVARNVGILSLSDAKSALNNMKTEKFDLVRIDCVHEDKPAVRYSFIYCGIGFGLSTLGTVKPWMKRIFGAKIAYYIGTVIGIIIYKPPKMKLSWSGKSYDHDSWVVFVGNAEWAGGHSMRLSPNASTCDGLFNLTIIKKQSRSRIMFLMPKISNGSHINDNTVTYFAEKELEITSDPPAQLEIDGDAFGYTPAKFTICPNAVEIVVLKK